MSALTDDRYSQIIKAVREESTYQGFEISKKEMEIILREVPEKRAIEQAIRNEERVKVLGELSGDQAVEAAARTLWTMRTESSDDLWANAELHGDERAMYCTEAVLILAAALATLDQEEGISSMAAKRPDVPVTLTYEEADTLMWEIGEGGIKTPGVTEATANKLMRAIEASRQSKGTRSSGYEGASAKETAEEFIRRACKLEALASEHVGALAYREAAAFIRLGQPSDATLDQEGPYETCGGSRTQPDKRGATSASGCPGCPDCLDGDPDHSKAYAELGDCLDKEEEAPVAESAYVELERYRAIFGDLCWECGGSGDAPGGFDDDTSGGTKLCGAGGGKGTK